MLGCCQTGGEKSYRASGSLKIFHEIKWLILCFQSETSVLKSRLSIAENKNVNLEKEKGELEGTIKSIKSSVKSESGKYNIRIFSLDCTTNIDMMI